MNLNQRINNREVCQREKRVDTWLGELRLSGYKVDAVKHDMGISVGLPKNIDFFMHWHLRQPMFRVRTNYGRPKYFKELEDAAEYVNELLRGP